MNSRRSPRRMKEISKFGASYYAGLTIEADPTLSTPKLAIDGHRIQVNKVGRSFLSFEVTRRAKESTLSALAKRIVDISWDRKKREKIRKKHLAELRKGVKSWNRWRREHPEIRPMLFGARLLKRNLRGANFCNANLIKADLRDARLQRANFHEANLGGAKLIGAKLMGANFCRTDLYETNLSRANLTGANLQGTQLARTDFRGATLNRCTIYGLSAWNLKLGLGGSIQKETRKQKKRRKRKKRRNGLEILYKVQQKNGKWEEGEFAVDNLELAQFVYLLLDNKRIKDFFDTMTSKAVVILGRFLPEARKAIMDGLRRALRKEGYLPIVFDFAKPKDRDLIETIKTLVGLCQFVIVDITNPRSSPLELGATVGDYQVPFVPIYQEGEKPFSMFKDLRKYDWVLDTLTYRSADDLSLVTKPLIIDRALKMYEKIRELKARKETEGLSATKYRRRLKKKPAVLRPLARGARLAFALGEES